MGDSNRQNDQASTPSQDELVARLEAELGTKKSKKGQESTQPTLREGIYMLIFELFLVGLLGGIYGRIKASIAPEQGADSFVAERWQDIQAIAQGFVHQLEEMWMIEATLVALTLIVAFGIPREKARRRYFGFVTSVTVLVLSLKLAGSLFHSYGP